MTNETRTNEKAESQELLQVEPMTLMHTGGFYPFLAEAKAQFGCSLREVPYDPDQRMFAGVSGDSIPEHNPAIWFYAHGRGDSYHCKTDRETTAVYKEDYPKRLRRTKIIKRLACEKGHEYTDMGIGLRAKNIFSFDEIRAIICYAKEDVEAFRSAIHERGINVQLFLEKENPVFSELYLNTFSTVEKTKDFVRGWSNLMPGRHKDIEDYKKLSTTLEETIKQEMIKKTDWIKKYPFDNESEEDKEESYKIWKKSTRENYSEAVQKYRIEKIKEREKRLIERIIWIRSQGKIPVLESYEDDVKESLRVANLKDGPIRWVYALCK